MTERKAQKTFVPPHEGGRTDRVVARLLGIGRRHARELIESGAVLVDGRRSRCGEKLHPTAEVTVLSTLAPTAGEPTPASEHPRVLWQRGPVLAVSKPAGYHSHRGKQRPSIAEFLAERYPGIENVGSPGVECGLVHRLDRDTSGIIVAAADAATFAALRAAFGRGDVSKDYLALVHGVVDSRATVDVPLARLRSHVRAARGSERSWAARTTIVPLERGSAWSLVLATMDTGVTHQVRAHLSLLGHPVIGDRKYGGEICARDPGGGQRLHASCIRLSGELTLAAPVDGRFLATLAQLRRATEEARR